MVLGSCCTQETKEEIEQRSFVVLGETWFIKDCLVRKAVLLESEICGRDAVTTILVSLTWNTRMGGTVLPIIEHRHWATYQGKASRYKGAFNQQRLAE